MRLNHQISQVFLLLAMYLLVAAPVAKGQSQRVDQIYKTKDQLSRASHSDKVTQLQTDLGFQYLPFNLDSAEHYLTLADRNIDHVDALTRGKILLLKGQLLSIRYQPGGGDYLFSALRAFEEAGSDKDQVQLIANICEARTNNLGKQQYLELIDKGKKLASRINYDQGLAYLLYVESGLEMETNNVDLAEKLLVQSLQLHKSSGHPNPTAVISDLGNIYYRKGMYAKAQKTYMEAMPFLIKEDDIFGFSYIYTNIGLAQSMQGQLDEALSSFNHALQYRYQANDVGGIFYTTIERGLLYLKRNEPQKAEEDLQKADSLNNGLFPDMYLLFKGKLKLAKGDIETGTTYLQEGLQQSTNDYNKFLINYELAKSSSILQNKKSNAKHIKACFDLANKLENEVLKVHASLLLAERQYKDSDFEAALSTMMPRVGSFTYHQAPTTAAKLLGWLMLINKKLSNYDQSLSWLNELQKLKETEAAQNWHPELDNLATLFEGQFIQDELELTKIQRRNQIILIFGLLIVLGLGLLVLILLTRKHRVDKQLLAKTQQNIKLGEENQRILKMKFKEFQEQSEKEKASLFESISIKDNHLNTLTTEINTMESELDVKETQLSKLLSLQLQKNELTQQVYDELKSLKSNKKEAHLSGEIKNLLEQDTGWHNFRVHFASVYPDFFENLKATCQDITPNELRISALIKMGLKNKEIASINGVSARAVEKARERLKKKLKVEDLKTAILEIK